MLTGGSRTRATRPRWLLEEIGAPYELVTLNLQAGDQKKPEYRRFSCDKGAFNIDAKLNGAYIAMGLLYGNRDLDQTMLISCRCGQDSDCNPSNSGGVLSGCPG